VKVRAMRPEDLPELKRIHEKFYKEQIFPNFSRNCIAAVVIEDDDGQIITAGGFKTVIKADVLTNKDAQLGLRGKALLELSRYANLACMMAGQDTLYAFVAYNGRDETWAKALESKGS
jgi:hypothetical protein